MAKKRTTWIALSPLILFTPYFLGYAKHYGAFHVASYDVLYPVFLIFFSIPFSWLPLNAFDEAVLSAHNDHFHARISPTLVFIHLCIFTALSFYMKKNNST